MSQMNWLDERRAEEPTHFMGVTNMYVNLGEDLKRLYDRAEIKCFRGMHPASRK